MSLLNIAAILSTMTASSSSSIQQSQHLISNMNHHNHNDLVDDLIGLNFRPNFHHYSGFLSALNDVYLHYWFFESQQNPLNDPLVLWLNGGPGCSSLVGALAENGPFRINSNLTVDYNPHTWNTNVNMLYIETPAQVGFSYKLDQNYQTNDNETAHMNLAALKSFYRKFPNFIQNDFYITGESYAGIFIPMLATLILDDHYPPNMKGFALGNPLLDQNININSQYFYLYSHGIIDEKIWLKLLQFCRCDHHHHHHKKQPSSSSSSSSSVRNCNFITNKSPLCQQAINLLDIYMNSFDLNLYNINSDCKQESINDELLLKNWKESSEKLNKLMISLPCAMDEHALTHWLNKKSVKKSLHVPSKFHWSFCNKVDYDRNETKSVRTEIERLIDSGINGLLYAGDLDVVCNFLGIQWFVDDLLLKESIDDNNKLRPMINHTYWKYNGQIGGFYKHYTTDGGSNLTFATIRGAGHSTAVDKPAETKYLFYKFLNQKNSDKFF
ncbi:lysosomal protective protein-like [Dermatophagoides farinae]|uniref:lysosomal protective protein-like n=1 Tax=Dermatophagoides farinae TaxID=6954 RepID=UPI003F614715